MDDLEKISYIFLLINSPLTTFFQHTLMPLYEFIVRNWSFPCELTKIKSDENKKKIRESSLGSGLCIRIFLERKSRLPVLRNSGKSGIVTNPIRKR